jgi:heat shock protein HslJ
MFRPAGVRLPVLLIALLVVAGCGGARPGGGLPHEDPQDSLRGKTFTAQRITERGQPMATVVGTSVKLQFTEDGRLVANAGCNTMSGPVTLTGDRLEVDLSTTEMGCDEARHRQDEWLSGVLSSRPSWRLAGDTLLLTTADTELELTSQKPAPLQGTRWTVTTLVDGQIAGAAPVAATLVFGGNQVTVEGLCNLRAVTYQQTGATLTFTLGPLTRKQCAPDIMKVETAAIAVLNGPATYTINGRILTITNGTQRLQLSS